MDFQGQKEKNPWIQYVVGGNLKKAFEIYGKNSIKIFLLKNMNCRYLAVWLYHIVVLLPVSTFSEEDNSVDLTAELILFWKVPDVVGIFVVGKILKNLVSKKTLPLRALAWYAHWLGIQGEYAKSLYIFRILITKAKTNRRLRGEIFSFYGSYLYSRNKIKSSENYHDAANIYLSEAGDDFYVLFNLGVAAKTIIQFGDWDLFAEKVLNRYDKLNPLTPDKRYGMRVLIYASLLLFLEGKNSLAQLFLDSSNQVFKDSDSELDKCSYSIFKSLICFLHRDMEGAWEWVKNARRFLQLYGTYAMYNRFILDLESFYMGKNVESSIPLLKKIKTMDTDLRNIEDVQVWYKEFFKKFSSLAASDVPKLTEKIKDLTNAEKVNILKVEDINYKSQQPINLSLDFSDNIKGTVINMDFISSKKKHKLMIVVPTRKWRNPDSLEIIKKALFLLQELQKIDYLESSKLVNEHLLEMGKFSRQIAHDIRSPLAALDIALSDLSFIENRKRQIVISAHKRINDIANNLLKRNKSEKLEAPMPTILSTVIDSIVSEKRIQFRMHKNITIEAEFSTDSICAFSNIDSVELGRVLSNLINNSIESFSSSQGRVIISLEKKEETLVIKVTDNGPGIPSLVLEKLGKEAISYGKNKRGNGLGVIHANEVIRNSGGNLLINSELNQGTSVSLTLPIIESPYWFKDTIEVSEKSIIIVIDDDESVYEIWSNLFENKELVHFTSPEDFKRWLRYNDSEHNIYLCDYEFLGSSINGIDLIEKLGIHKKALLVSSKVDDTDLTQKCNKLGIKAFPKKMSNFIKIKPINLTPFDLVLIDDDDLVHTSWQVSAEQSNKNIKGYTTVDKFLSDAHLLDRNIPIFVDSHLEDEVKGEVESEKIANMGFKSIFIATGFSKKDIKRPKWIKSIVNKSFPEEIIISHHIS